jgi:hypothetical protein
VEGIIGQSGQKAKFQQRGYCQVLPALFRRTPGPYQRDYYTSANHEGLQGVKDLRGPVGMTASPASRAPDEVNVIITSVD